MPKIWRAPQPHHEVLDHGFKLGLEPTKGDDHCSDSVQVEVDGLFGAPHGGRQGGGYPLPLGEVEARERVEGDAIDGVGEGGKVGSIIEELEAYQGQEEVDGVGGGGGIIVSSGGD